MVYVVCDMMMEKMVYIFLSQSVVVDCIYNGRAWWLTMDSYLSSTSKVRVKLRKQTPKF